MAVALRRLAHARDLACEALLLAYGLTQTVGSPALWRDHETGRLLPAQQALDLWRPRAELDPSRVMFVKALDVIEEGLLRGAGWRTAPLRGGFGWGRGTRVCTRTEAVGHVLRELAGQPDAPPDVTVDRSLDFDQTAHAANDHRDPLWGEKVVRPVTSREVP